MFLDGPDAKARDAVHLSSRAKKSARNTPNRSPQSMNLN
jgi:hypothetical protein